MSQLLFVKSSVFGDGGQSSKLADHFIQRWTASHADAQVVVRDLVDQPIAHFDLNAISALSTDAAERSPAQQEIAALSDTLIGEVQRADAIVIAAPMYNFAVPSQLKAWFDQIARNGVTFRYTENGPEGLLDNKPVYILATRGGQYHEAGLDYQVPWLKLILGFVGLNNVEVILAEGLNMGDAEQSIQAAQSAINALSFN